MNLIEIFCYLNWNEFFTDIFYQFNKLIYRINYFIVVNIKLLIKKGQFFNLKMCIHGNEFKL